MVAQRVKKKEGKAGHERGDKFMKSFGIIWGRIRRDRRWWRRTTEAHARLWVHSGHDDPPSHILLESNVRTKTVNKKIKIKNTFFYNLILTQKISIVERLRTFHFSYSIETEL